MGRIVAQIFIQPTLQSSRHTLSKHTARHKFITRIFVILRIPCFPAPNNQHTPALVTPPMCSPQSFLRSLPYSFSMCPSHSFRISFYPAPSKCVFFAGGNQRKRRNESIFFHLNVIIDHLKCKYFLLWVRFAHMFQHFRCHGISIVFLHVLYNNATTPPPPTY